MDRAILVASLTEPPSEGGQELVALAGRADWLEVRADLVGDATGERGGRPRRYFTVTPQGLAALRTTHAALRNLATGLESVLERP